MSNHVPKTQTGDQDNSARLNDQEHLDSHYDIDNSSVSDDNDLEISNKSLLTINEMLEKIVRHQAKQVASFKNKMMTCPDTEKQDEQQRQDVRDQVENEGDDWENDEQFIRLKKMTEMLIEQAQNALSSQAQAIGGRVLMAGHHHRRSNSSRRHRNTHSSNDLQQQ
ncbi:hypothetical protein [Parasitella parasitica]|uniref:Uncharacterized protein n=1 Tax=Parasitella parasitica TaxID=35722 RepID=A0A0B7NGT2_9FUNG|nr:hypothetical protein [Parasitella parasitica]